MDISLSNNSIYTKVKSRGIINDYAQTLDHQIEFIEAKPSFGNIVVWKVIYTTSDKYVNAIRLSLFIKSIQVNP